MCTVCTCILYLCGCAWYIDTYLWLAKNEVSWSCPEMLKHAQACPVRGKAPERDTKQCVAVGTSHFSERPEGGQAVWTLFIK